MVGLSPSLAYVPLLNLGIIYPQIKPVYLNLISERDSHVKPLVNLMVLIISGDLSKVTSSKGSTENNLVEFVKLPTKYLIKFVSSTPAITYFQL